MPKFHLQFKSHFYMNKFSKSSITEMVMNVKIDYKIIPQVSLEILQPIESKLNFEFSKEKREFETEISIGNVARIPGRISFYDFRVKSIKIFSEFVSGAKMLKISTESCYLKGKIDTGYRFLNEKIINNIGQGIVKETDSSCKMSIDFSTYSSVEIQFSFKVHIEWDKRKHILYSYFINPLYDSPLSEWLLSKENYYIISFLNLFQFLKFYLSYLSFF